MPKEETVGIKSKWVGAVIISTNLATVERAWGLMHKKRGSNRVLKNEKF